MAGAPAAPAAWPPAVCRTARNAGAGFLDIYRPDPGV